MSLKFQHAGFSLIEVLIALCITTIILIEITTAQIQSLRTNQQAFFVNQAAEQIQSMAQIIQENNGNFAPFLSSWNEDNNNLLPLGVGEVKHFGDKYKIYLYWKSVNTSFWRCDIAQQKKQSCVELIT